MEVFCRVSDETRRDGSNVDVVLHVEPSHSVATLTRVVAHHLGVTAPLAELELARHASGPALDAHATLSAVGLLSGQHLQLRCRSAVAPTALGSAAFGPVAFGSTVEPADFRPLAFGREGATVAAWELVVASGPDTGRRQPLAVGPALIGRDRSCWLVLDDPKVSRVHLELDVAIEPGSPATIAVTVAPAAEAHGPLRLNGRPLTGPAPVAPGDRLCLGATSLRVQSVAAAASVAEGMGEVAFHRTPYFPTPVVGRLFEPTGDIPERPEPARFAYLAALVPLVMGVTMALIYSPRFLVFAAFSPVMAVGAYFDQRRRTAQRFGRGSERYQAKRSLRRAEVSSARAEERERRFLNAPDLIELADRADRRAVEVWIRDRQAADFLTLRLGLGDLPSAVRVKPETRGDEALRDELSAELAAGAVLGDVPVTISLTELPVLALVGPELETTALAASLASQAACLHSPEDLVMVAAVADGRHLSQWLRWLPHTRSPSSPLSRAHLATDARSAEHLLRELLEVAESRADHPDRALDHRWPWLLAVIDRDLEPEPAAVARLLDLAPHVGLSVLWLTTAADRVPRQARATVTCQLAVGTEASHVAFVDPSRADQRVEIDRAPRALADRMARSLATLRDASSATAASALPRVVTLRETLGDDAFTAEGVVARWRRLDGYQLLTPIGLSTAGPLVIDLVEHGPHGLIGGTSGAGKSELLMSLVAGLVACSPPTRLNVLFVDYKGGASSDRFKDLPHTVGYVTNLDALLAQRALVSLRAELTRRMSLLQGRAKDLAEMILRHPEAAPPSLVIVVDEFATLVKEVPEFVAGMVDIAQRGRSLGIHLILATQRPSGAVNENILANTNLRISLRMLEAAESTAVIGTNDAATIPTPLKGRAYARLGPGQLAAFQSAWSGAPQRPDQGPPPLVLVPFGATPSVSSVPPAQITSPATTSPATTGPTTTSPTQLDSLVAAVSGAATALGMGRGRSPWLDQLPEHLALSQLVLADRARPEPSPSAPPPTGWPVAIGLVDDPAAQSQYPAEIDLETGGGLLVLGTGGSGKTTVLRTLTAAAIRSAGPGRSSTDPDPGSPTVVVLDFASRELLALGALPQCAAVAAGDDLEAVTRIIALLDRLVEARRATLARAARQAEGPPRFSRVLLVIDDYGTLAQTFEGAGAASQLYPWLETLNRVIVEGRQVAIHTALSASRRAVVKAGLLSAIANRLVLRQADAGGYTDAGVPAAVANDLQLPPGRGFINGSRVMQVARLAPPAADNPDGRIGGGGPDDRPADRADDHGRAEAAALRSLVTAAQPAPPAEPMPELSIGALPIHLDLAHLAAPRSAPTPMQVVLGQADLELAPVVVDLTYDNLVVLGEPRSGRSTALLSIAGQLAAGTAQVWTVGPPGSPLAGLPGAHRGGFGRPAAVADILAELAAAVDPHGSSPTGRSSGAGDGETRPVLVIDDVDLLEDPALDPVLGRLLAAGVRYVAATASLRGYSISPLTQDMKKARSLLYLQPPGSREVQEVAGVNPRLRPGLALVPGRGVLVVKRAARVVQVALPPAAVPGSGYSMPWSRA